MNPLGLIFGFKSMAIAVAIALSVGGVAGWRTKAKFADAAQLKAVTAAYQKSLATLQGRIKTANDAAKTDQERAAAAEQLRAQAEEKANALETKISGGVCFDSGDADRLRELWSRPDQRPAR